MKVKDYIRADTLVAKLYGLSHPLEQGFEGVEKLLTAIEQNAGLLIPDEFSVGTGKTPSFSIDKVRRMLARKDANDYVNLLLSQSDAPYVEYAFTFIVGDVSIKFELWIIIPFAFFQDQGQQLQRSRDFVSLIKAIADACDVVYGFAHNEADFFLGTDPHLEDPFAEKKAYEAYWLNVYGPEMIEEIGRHKVMTIPASRFEELSNGAVLWLTRPTPTDYAIDEARQVQAKCLAHLRDDISYDEALVRLRERSAILAPVERDWDPDIEDLLELTLDDVHYAHRQLEIVKLNEYRPPEVSEWLPIEQILPSDVDNIDETITHYTEFLAEKLAALLHNDVPEVMECNPASLPFIDYHFWHFDYPQDFERKDIEESLVPAIGAYLGDVMVRYLGGRWVPRINIDESQVAIGERVWLPFLRARQYMQSKKSVLDYSLTKYFRAAQNEVNKEIN